MSRAEIVVDLAAIRHNVTVLKQHVGVPLMAVVKADGYGHGMLPVARAAREAGAEWLGVATADEALALRAAGDEGPILCWLTVPGDDLGLLVDQQIDVTVYTAAELERLPKHARVQLKIDTGLSRGGATRAQWPALVARASAWDVTGIWSHFATSEDQSDPSNDEQQKLFDEALAIAADAGIVDVTRHLANSGAILLRPQARYDLVRAGLSMYGLSPAPGATPDLGLVPAMTVRADLALVKEIPAGASVSYGGTWTAPVRTTLGLVPVGYGEGVPRAAANRAEVLIGGKRRPIRGSVCMDQVVVDLGGDVPRAGDDVVLFGPGTGGEPTADDWAVASETISWEIITRMGGRLVRRYEGGN